MSGIEYLNDPGDLADRLHTARVLSAPAGIDLEMLAEALGLLAVDAAQLIGTDLRSRLRICPDQSAAADSSTTHPPPAAAGAPCKSAATATRPPPAANVNNQAES